MDRLIASYADARERDQLNTISGFIEKQVYEDSPGVFLYQARSIFLHTPALKNFSINGHGIPLIYRSSLGYP